MQVVAQFEQTLCVDAADLDRLGHVNNIVYLRWVQDVAVAHWRFAATAAEQAEVIWVVLRHEIDYQHPARLDDELAIRTWVGQATGLRFERHTVILRRSDEKPLAKALTIWCPVDPVTGRPCRVSPEIRARFTIDRRGATRLA